MSSPRILIIGESCVDEFAYCQATRLAPDWPVPILEIENITSNPGMARNVLANLQSMGAIVKLESNNNWKEFKKRRYVHSKTNHTFFRVDSQVNINEIGTLPDMSTYDAVVISDYNKGFLSEENIWKISNLHKRVFLDTKKPLDDWASSAFLIKINDFEFNKSLPYVLGPIKNRVIRTLGEKGCEFQGKLYPTEKVFVSDSSGAGDTFISAFVCSFLASESIEISIQAANIAATNVVKRRGVVAL
jgi:D-beta-D-heptose 7-phosphate kinase/D-beta-D-heptose 1-phosphate adenosyltransferase